MEDGVSPTNGWIMFLAKKLFAVFKAAGSSLSLLPPNRKLLLLRIVHASACCALGHHVFRGEVSGT